MSSTNIHKTLANELETLASYANDSVSGFQTAADRVGSASETIKRLFIEIKAERQGYVAALNERLECIGKEEETNGTLKGTAHRALINIKDFFTGEGDEQAIVAEAIRGETKLAEYIDEAIEEIPVADSASNRAIADLKSHVLSSILKLRNLQLHPHG